MTWFVEIVKYETDEVVKRIECGSERIADRVDYGVNINLNHDQYYTRVVNEQPAEPPHSIDTLLEQLPIS